MWPGRGPIGREPPRHVATDRVTVIFVRAAVKVGFQLARRDECIKECVDVMERCRARRGLTTSRSSPTRVIGMLMLTGVRDDRDQCTTELLNLPDFQISHPWKARNLVRNLFWPRWSFS